MSPTRQIRRADRAQKHEAAAEWIEQLSGERDDKAELLADHYTQALTLRQALGEDVARLAPRARAAFTEAGDQAAAVNAHPAAARHYHAALDLTPLDDIDQRAELLLGEATALWHANTADEHTLQAAVDAQVAAQRWEAAACAVGMLSRWLEHHAGNGEERDALLARAAEYAARVPPSEEMCDIATDQTFRLVVSGQAKEALALTNQMIPIAKHAGLEVGQAMLLQWRGYARCALGDPHGVSDMEGAARTLANHADRATVSAYVNLADAARGLGDMPAADAAYITAAKWATRFARPYHIDLVATDRASQPYHAADWDTAQRLLDTIDPTNRRNDVEMHTTRGRISLARGDTAGALTAATAITSYAMSTGSDAVLYDGLALEALCHAAVGRNAEALAASERFLTRWHNSDGNTTRAIELCEITPTLAGAGRHEGIRNAALLLPEACRWRDALLHIAEQRYADAAELYEEIGSRPLAADAHLLAAGQARREGRAADAQQHAEAVIDFANRTGAAAYRQRAEALIAATA